MRQFYEKLEEALQILRHVEAAEADPITAPRIRTAIRQIKEVIALATEAGPLGKVPANSNEVSSDQAAPQAPPKRQPSPTDLE